MIETKGASDHALRATFQELQEAKDQLLQHWTKDTFADLSSALQEQQQKTDESHAAAAEVMAEMKHLRRLMREYPETA